MATADQIKALLTSHVDCDDQRFRSIALQIAANEARRGHDKLASDIKKLVEDNQKTANTLEPVGKSKLVDHQTKNELNGLIELTPTSVRINELVLSENISERLEQVILEQKQKEKLAQFGLLPRRKLLFTGPPGTGKTMSSFALATELKLPMYTIVLDNLITRFMGETAANLRLIFDHIKNNRAVYLFDEFDAIGSQRGADNDVGEARRVLNSFLMLVEQDFSESIILAATNHPELLDKALYRRFDDIIRFEKPDRSQINQLIENRLAQFKIKLLDWDSISKAAFGLSSAEVTSSCEDAAKEAVLNYDAKISTDLLLKAIERRHNKLIRFKLR